MVQNVAGSIHLSINPTVNKYSKIPILRPPFGLLESGLIREVVLISNIISLEKYHLGLGKTSLNSEVVLILGGLNSDILLYLYYVKCLVGDA